MVARHVDHVATEARVVGQALPGQGMILLAHAEKAAEGHDRVFGVAALLSEHDVVDVAEMLALAKALDVPAGQAAALFDQFNPGVTIPARLRRMIEATFDDRSWDLVMARKDAGLMIEAAAAAGVPLAVLPAIAARMDAVIAEGHGCRDWTVIAKDVVT